MSLNPKQIVLHHGYFLNEAWCKDVEEAKLLFLSGQRRADFSPKRRKKWLKRFRTRIAPHRWLFEYPFGVPPGYPFQLYQSQFKMGVLPPELRKIPILFKRLDNTSVLCEVTPYEDETKSKPNVTPSPEDLGTSESGDQNQTECKNLSKDSPGGV